jgi:hypothetical protein
MIIICGTDINVYFQAVTVYSNFSTPAHFCPVQQHISFDLYKLNVGLKERGKKLRSSFGVLMRHCFWIEKKA